MNADLREYVESHIDPQPDYLVQLERMTNLHLHNGRMCSGHLQGRLLKMLVGMISPMRVLELGTFSGYSALCIAEALKPSAAIDTIEADDELEDFIRTAIERSPFPERVRLHIGPALEVMKQWEDGTFDLAFIDADKREYKAYYEAVLPLLRPGGYIIADNTLWDGHVIEADKMRDPQTRGIREFNDYIAADPRVEKVIIPLRDGLTIARLCANANEKLRTKN
jgi:predicted O-methyltransferase YrrM